MNGSKKTLGVLLVYDWLCGYSDGTRYMEIGRADN